MKGDTCRVDGCNRIITENRTVCNSCRCRKKRWGTYTGGPIIKTDEEMFWSKVNKTNSCWLISGAIKNYNGYGRTSFNKKFIYAHRFSWQLHNGCIPDGLHVLHKCDVKNCVNPDHLFLGTNLDNIKDRMKKGRSYSPCLKGEKNPASKLKNNEVIEIKKLLARGNTIISTANKFSVAPYTISCIKNNATWKHV